MDIKKKWTIYFPLLVLLILWCFTTPAKTKSSSSKLEDILNVASSNIRPGMLTKHLDSFEEFYEEEETSTLSNESSPSNISENSAASSKSRKLVHLAMMSFSSIFLLYYK